jgi:hypothetical protein
MCYSSCEYYTCYTTVGTVLAGLGLGVRTPYGFSPWSLSATVHLALGHLLPQPPGHISNRPQVSSRIGLMASLVPVPGDACASAPDRHT